jgi:hypothetical protein
MAVPIRMRFHARAMRLIVAKVQTSLRQRSAMNRDVGRRTTANPGVCLPIARPRRRVRATLDHANYVGQHREIFARGDDEHPPARALSTDV